MSSTLLLQLCVFFQGSIAWIRPYLSQQSSSGTHWRPTRSWRWWRDLASRLPGRGSGRGGNTHLPVDKYINVRTWPWGETQNHNFELHLRSISTTWSRSSPWRTLKHVSRFTWRHVKKNLSETKTSEESLCDPDWILCTLFPVNSFNTNTSTLSPRQSKLPPLHPVLYQEPWCMHALGLVWGEGRKGERERGMRDWERSERTGCQLALCAPLQSSLWPVKGGDIQGFVTGETCGGFFILFYIF